MKACYTILSFLVLFVLTVFPSKTQATHVTGGDISYACTATPGIFEITLVVFRRCDGGNTTLCASTCGAACSLTMDIKGADASCATTTFGTVSLSLVSVRDADIKPQCPTSKNACNNMGCVTPGTYTPAIERYEFKGFANIGPTSGIPASCCNVRVGWDYCCRNSNIITGPADATMYIDAVINRCQSITPCNSSPVLKNDPYITACTDQSVFYNNGAWDPDGDSLSFSFAPAFAAYGTPVPYAFPFTFDKPMPWTGTPTAPFPAGIRCDPITGDIMFTTPYGGTGTIAGVIAIEVKQWKKVSGIPTVIGVTRRDVQMFVRADCTPNSQPRMTTIPPDTGNVNNPKTKWEVCEGQQLCFTVIAKDSDFSLPTISDTTYLNWDSTLLSLGATFLPTYNTATRNIGGPREDSYQFCWTPTQGMAHTNPYMFSVGAVDSKCPNPGRLRRGFLVTVIKQADVSITKTNKQCGKWQVGYTQNIPGQLFASTTFQIAKEPFDYSFTAGSSVYNNTSSSPIIPFTKGGKYLIKLTLQTGSCSKIFYDTLTVDSPLTVFTNDTIACAGTPITLPVAATNGVAPYSYRWFNNISDTASTPLNAPNFSQPNFTPTVNTSRYYTIQVKDVNGCSSVDSVWVFVKTLIQQVTVNDSKCNGSNNGNVQVTANGSLATTFQYKLDSGVFQSTNNFTNLTPGAHTLTVKDSTNCINTQTITIKEPSVLKDTLTTVTPQSCIGPAGGSIFTLAKGGIAPYKYSKDSIVFDSVHSFTNLIPGTYKIHIIDSNYCYTSFSKTVLPADSLKYTTTVKHLSCFGTSTGEIKITATGGKKPYTYKLGTGVFVADSVFKNLTANTYSFTIKDANSCTLSFMDSITSPAPLLQNTIVKNQNCFGGTIGSIRITATGGIPPYEYKQLSSSLYDTISQFNNLTAGLYSLSIKDKNNCLLNFSKTIQQPKMLKDTLTTVADQTCIGVVNGSILTLATGGTAPYKYSIDSIVFDTIHSFTNLIPGTYKIHITDSNFCYATFTKTVLKADTIKYTTTVKHLLCSGTTTGEVKITATGGKKPFSYKLGTGPFVSDSIFKNLAPGTYPFTIMDANSCTLSFIDSITSPTPVQQTTTTKDPNCFGGNNGSITISAGGGTPPYSYKQPSGSLFDTVSQFNNLTAGTYSLSLKDKNNCLVSFSKTIQQPTIINTSIATQATTCFGTNDGKITITATGGVPPYTYSLNSSAFSSTNTWSNLPGGAYLLTIKDSLLCEKAFTTAITNTPKVSFLIAQKDISCFSKADGSITATPIIGRSPFTYNINGGAYNVSPIFTGLAATTHLIGMRDSLGCSDSVFVVLQEPAKIVAGTISGPATTLMNATETYSATPQPGLNFIWAAEKGTILGGDTTPTINIRWDTSGIGKVGYAVYSDTTCGDTAGMVVSIGAIGLTELSQSWGLNIYPNPAKNSLNIILQKLPEHSQIELYDVQGKLVLQQELKLSQQLNIEKLAAGIYILKIGAWSGQVVKE